MAAIRQSGSLKMPPAEQTPRPGNRDHRKVDRRRRARSDGTSPQARLESLGVPVARAPARAARSAKSAWVRNPIDRFILARLEKEGLRPSPEADKITLLRRAASRSHRASAPRRRKSTRSSPTRARTPTSGRWSDCSPRRITASAGAAIGSTRRVMPTPTPAAATSRGRSTSTASG